MDEQRQLILDQFTRQAVPFSEMHARDDAGIHRLLIETADIGPEDEVLDVACGPGLVACEVAKVARHVTGVDLTRAMIEQAEARQTLARADQPDLGRRRRPAARVPGRVFLPGHHPLLVPSLHRPGRGVRRDGPGLPARRAGDRLRRVHHLPGARRGLRPAGAVPRPVPHPRPATGRARRPVRRPEGRAAGVLQVPGEVDDLLSRSFPEPGGAEAFRRTVESDVGVNRLGIDASREGGLGFAFPVVIVSGVKPRG